MGVVTPHFGRQMQLLPLTLFPLSGSFNERVETKLSSLLCVKAVEPLNAEGYQHRTLSRALLDAKIMPIRVKIRTRPGVVARFDRNVRLRGRKKLFEVEDFA